MEVLFTFLNWVSSFSHVDEESGSKMDIHNLATVITPNILHMGKIDVPVDDSFLGIEAIHSLIEYNEAMCEVSQARSCRRLCSSKLTYDPQIPEDLSLILNDSSLFSSSADITTKEILKKYGERARAPLIAAGPGESAVIESPRSREGNKSNITPVATRVDMDPNQTNAMQNESSVRHVKEGFSGPGMYAESGGSSGFATPNMPYTHRNDSRDSLGSPSRKQYQNGPGSGYEKGRVMGMT